MKRNKIMELIKKYVKKAVATSLVAIVISGIIIPAKPIMALEEQINDNKPISSFTLSEDDITYETVKTEAKVEKKVIAIEAGHGYNSKTGQGDPGAIAYDGKAEATRTMELTNILKNKLEQKGYEVVLVREGNYAMSLGEKQRKMNEISPNLSLSIHFNSAKSPQATGSEVLCNKKSIDIYGENFAMDMAKAMANKQGITNRGVTHVGEGNGERRLYTRSNRINSANLLLEVCFTSNENETKNYDNIKYKVADSIVDTIVRYVK